MFFSFPRWDVKEVVNIQNLDTSRKVTDGGKTFVNPHYMDNVQCQGLDETTERIGRIEPWDVPMFRV